MNTTRSTRHASRKWVLVPEAARASANAYVELDSDKLKHLRKVLRMEWDDELYVLDGEGRQFEARLEKRGGEGGVRIGTLVREEPEPESLELVICLPKNATMDWVVEKAVECGASRITPVVSSRSVVRVDANETDKYVRRWQAIMDGAVEQSERLWRTQVAPPTAWNSWLSTKDDGVSFVCVSESRLAKTDEQALTETWQLLRSSKGQPARILIGPEGGFTDEERDALNAKGFRELSLGTAVLRVETAVITALTLLRVSRLVSVT